MKVMNLSKEFIDNMLNCPWLQMCGQKEKLDFAVEYLNSEEKVQKSINSTKWENLCLDQMGDFTAYLSRNYREEYNKNWNEKVRMIKKEYIPRISNDIERVLLNNKLSFDILDDVKMNILSLFMLEYYSDYYTSEFYNKMLIIYMKGHLPCGWSGKYPTGKFKVY